MIANNTNGFEDFTAMKVEGLLKHFLYILMIRLISVQVCVGIIKSFINYDIFMLFILEKAQCHIEIV